MLVCLSFDWSLAFRTKSIRKHHVIQILSVHWVELWVINAHTFSKKCANFFHSKASLWCRKWVKSILNSKRSINRYYKRNGKWHCPIFACGMCYSMCVHSFRFDSGTYSYDIYTKNIEFGAHTQRKHTQCPACPLSIVHQLHDALRWASKRLQCVYEHMLCVNRCPDWTPSAI